MKVLISGNIASVGYNLSKGLLAKGIDADLIYQRSSIGIEEGTREDWIKIYYPPLYWSAESSQIGINIEKDRAKKYVMNIIPKFKNRIQYLTLPGINLAQYDLFHLNYLGNKLNIGIALRHKLKDWKKPIIVYLLGSKTPRIKTGIQGLRNYFITHRAKLILCGTPRRLKYVQHFPHKKEVLPIPIDTNKFRSILTESYNNRILCWVKLEKIKGIDIIFKAAELLPKYRFDIPNVGVDAEYYKKIKPKNVVFISKMPHKQVPDLINKYPLILGQFHIGGYGASEVEAMACGKPVIAYLDFKYEDYYNEPCPLLSSKDPEEIVELIHAHIGDKNLGKLNRKWAVKYHSIENVTSKLIRIYERVLG
ncbi:MAG: glycosyltransferase family 4 protein [Thermoplasmata archaeon]|nr:glycosyltransferase family 4 protein [Thermoplasmata archaeon]